MIGMTTGLFICDSIRGLSGELLAWGFALDVKLSYAVYRSDYAESHHLAWSH